MKLKSFAWWTVILACAVIMLTSCSTMVVCRSGGRKIGHGPPPHAPAHGRRRKLASGVEVVFDSECGVYVVVGFERHFWLDGHYYRFCNGRWEASVSIGSGWKAAEIEKLPPGLRGKYKAKHASKTHPGRGLALGKQKQ